jgi:hypothetical protein
MSFGSSSSSSSSNGDAATPSVTEEVDREFSPVSPTIVDLVEFTRTGRALILPQSLNEHWTAHSIPILLNVYYTLDFLHDTYKKSGPQGPLLWATHLFARTYITNLRHPTAIDNGSVEQTDKELGTYLGKTLSSVSEALKTPEGAMRDDVLATVWILTNYEVSNMTSSRHSYTYVLIASYGLHQPHIAPEPVASPYQWAIQYSSAKRNGFFATAGIENGFLACLQHGGMSLRSDISLPTNKLLASTVSPDKPRVPSGIPGMVFRHQTNPSSRRRIGC